MKCRRRDRTDVTDSPRRRDGFSLLAARLLLITAAGAACNGDSAGPDGAPEVMAVSPAAGVASAPVTGSVIAWFTEAIDPGTVEGGLVLDQDGREYRGEVAVREGTALEFLPSDPLDFGTAYTATVRTSVGDRQGERLAREYSWNFHTQGTAPPSLDRDSMRSHIRALADDSMMGRAAGTADELRAAQYLAERFEAWGLDPLLGTLIQPFRAPSLRNGAMLDSRNVLAVVPGNGALAAEWVIVGAHYDAQGVISDGAGGVLVRNGADDNASGTAVVLELARLYRRWTSLGGTAGVPRRAVLFAGFGSEEEGLVGSCTFVGTGAVPVQRMAAMVNFDMVGRLRANTVTAQSGGSASAWDDMLANTNAAGVVIDPNPACKSCSDYACFGSAGVPYVWFFTGTHAEYHRPEDDEPLIDYGGMVAIGDMAFRVLARLAVAPGRPAAGAPAGGAERVLR